ncbi:hypothetical protein DET50_10968 [Marinobacter pelagius]|uniref:Soluble cytochrome b562 n=1 Tax=Marinobacter pelagius TaxID=379482 RepID=A0A366GT96_9GAMM|nr:DUF6746 family protein [Marinobacter pelagius]RBP29718.1 hypothetical protein DET50_10968 [Marinobacter pelagius]
MKITRNLTLVAAALMFSLPALAEDYEHYEGEPAETLEQAVTNFSKYNNKLDKLLAGELNPEAMNEIHQLTYTLENALNKLNGEFDDLAERLELVHEASEYADPETVEREGSIYLQKSRKVVP